MNTFYFEIANLDGDFGLIPPVKKSCKDIVETFKEIKNEYPDRLIREMPESKGKLIFKNSK